MKRIFGHYIPINLTILATVEFLVFIGSFYLALEIRFYESVLNDALAHQLHLKVIVYAIALFIGFIGVGLYSRSMRESFSGVFTKLIAGMLLGFLILTIIYYVMPNWLVGRGTTGIALGVTFIAVLMIRHLYLNVVDRDFLNSRALVIGTGSIAQQVELLKRKSDWRGMTLVGFLHIKGDVDKVKAERIIRSELPLVDLVADYGVDEIIVAVDEQRKNYPVDEIIDCKMLGIQVTELSTFFEKRSGRLQVDTLHPHRFIFLEGFNQDIIKVIVKRIVDISLSLLLMSLTLLLYPILVILIKRESGLKSPVFYSQTRVGQNEENFTIYKFRSMIENAEKSGAQFASKDDARVTSIGKIMRKTRLDELPQLWNVLKGDMSFVGPRPERPEFVEKLAENIPYYRMRHRVKPGITGWAQICYPYGDGEKDAKEKLQYDLYYIKNYSVFLDIAVLAQTAQVILWQKGAR